MIPRAVAVELDKTDWQGYLAAESRVFDEVKANVTDKLSASERIASNPFFPYLLQHIDNKL